MKNEEIKILQIIQKFGKENKLNPFILENFGLDGSFEKDLGLDSLARMELISEIEEHFKASIPENLIATLETPRDLLRAIAGNEGKIVSEKEMDLTRELATFPDSSQSFLKVKISSSPESWQTFI
jgi:acyl carrier protein